MSSADILLHPVRLRVLQAFLGRESLTIPRLRELLPEVSPATLYRQVGTLLDAEVLEVVSEQKVRGAVERTFRIRPANASVGAEESAAMSVEDHRRAFLTFVAGLVADFDRYLENDDVDLARDLIGYRQRALVVTDEELLDFLDQLSRSAAPLAERPEDGGRRRRLFTTVVLSDPVPRGADGPADEG